MVRRPCLTTSYAIEELGFGQLNDLLLVLHFPEMAREFFDSSLDDERQLVQLLHLTRRPPFRDFGADLFICEVEKRIKELSSQWAFWKEKEGYSGPIIANLCWIAFAVERWGQAVLRRRPGSVVRSLELGNGGETVHEFLVKRLGNYNTLEHFAIRGIGTVESIRRFRFHKGHLISSSWKETASPYKKLVPHADVSISRFPSTLDMLPFLEVIKKGEMAAQVYNDQAIALVDVILREGLHSEKALDLASGVSLGLRIAKQAIIDFLATEGFTTTKFIYVLRQFTVELDESPADVLLQHFTLEAHERILAKGFLNHYLQHGGYDERSSGLRIWEWLRNEGADMPSAGVWIAQFCCANSRARRQLVVDALRGVRSKGRSTLPILENAVLELLAGGEEWRWRLTYALKLFKLLIPRVANAAAVVSDDVRLLRDIQNKLEASEYTLPPSGANSLAFFGGDVLVGVVDEVPNYRTHLLNRLPIMIRNDQRRFWRLIGTDFVGLPRLIQSHLLGKPLREAREQYRPYLEIIHTLADLSKAHNASVEKFLRRVAQQMMHRTKERLLSSPDHGTTFMQPTRRDVAVDDRLALPSINRLNEARAEAQRFVRERLGQANDYERTGRGSPEFYRSFFAAKRSY